LRAGLTSGSPPVCGGRVRAADGSTPPYHVVYPFDAPPSPRSGVLGRRGEWQRTDRVQYVWVKSPTRWLVVLRAVRWRQATVRGTTVARPQERSWRRRPESNRWWRFCSHRGLVIRHLRSAPQASGVPAQRPSSARAIIYCLMPRTGHEGESRGQIRGQSQRC